MSNDTTDWEARRAAGLKWAWGDGKWPDARADLLERFHTLLSVDQPNNWPVPVPRADLVALVNLVEGTGP